MEISRSVYFDPVQLRGNDRDRAAVHCCVRFHLLAVALLARLADIAGVVAVAAVIRIHQQVGTNAGTVRKALVADRGTLATRADLVRPARHVAPAAVVRIDLQLIAAVGAHVMTRLTRKGAIPRLTGRRAVLSGGTDVVTAAAMVGVTRHVDTGIAATLVWGSADKVAPSVDTTRLAAGGGGARFIAECTVVRVAARVDASP